MECSYVEEGNQCQHQAEIEVAGLGRVCHYHRGAGGPNGWSPVPWHYVSGAVWTTPNGPDDGGQCIAMRASASFIWPTVRDANLRLCSAAPDLFDALEWAEHFITAAASTMLALLPEERIAEHLNQIRAALKKAKPE